MAEAAQSSGGSRSGAPEPGAVERGVQRRKDAAWRFAFAETTKRRRKDSARRGHGALTMFTNAVMMLHHSILFPTARSFTVWNLHDCWRRQYTEGFLAADIRLNEWKY
jgi:hypothetical protein